MDSPTAEVRENESLCGQEQVRHRVIGGVNINDQQEEEKTC